jgi:hypothetical protein
VPKHQEEQQQHLGTAQKPSQHSTGNLGGGAWESVLATPEDSCACSSLRTAELDLKYSTCPSAGIYIIPWRNGTTSFNERNYVGGQGISTFFEPETW